MSWIKSFFPNEKRKATALGIDLGTTNSLIAEAIWDVEAQAPVVRCIEVKQTTASSGIYTHILIPSIVALLDGKKYIGQGAKILRGQVGKSKLRLYKDIFFECKNLMGIRRTFNLAPKGYESAAMIAGHILQFLKEAVSSKVALRTVVTVPASFQIAQRQDTIMAAKLAGIDLQEEELLDEPIAAFIDYLHSAQGKSIELKENEEKNLLVFDFGGGTCDVAIFRLRIDSVGLSVKPLTVSRFHRLGGGDIDKAIIHQVLVPQLIEQNKLKSLDLSYDAKKSALEPELLSIAESLKIDICRYIKKLQEFNRYENANKDEESVELAYSHNININNKDLRLHGPKITISQFEKVLEPFIDKEFLYMRENDYYSTCSVFSPISDALSRCNIDPSSIDYCFMVGGSSLIPHMEQALAAYFDRAVMLGYEDYESVQNCVARGAALQALSIELYGHGLIRTIVSEDIFINTTKGPQLIIPHGHELPFPTNQKFASFSELALSEGSRINPVNVLIEFRAGAEGRLLQGYTWELQPPTTAGEEIQLNYRLDKNQVFQAILQRKNASNRESLDCTIDHPLASVVNPSELRIRVEEIEEKLRRSEIPPSRIISSLVELARLYTELGSKEKALELYDKALKYKNAPDGVILNSKGLLYGQLGDRKREEQHFERAAIDGRWPGAWFNLALAYKRYGRIEDALNTVNKAIADEEDAPYLVLKAELESMLGHHESVGRIMADAWELFPDVDEMSDWELHWYTTGAKLVKDQEKVKSAEREKKSRSSQVSLSSNIEGKLPGLRE